MTVTIDTLAARRDLVAAGIEPAQAEAIIGAFAHTGEQVATKADLQRLETETAGATTGLKTEILGVNTRIDGLRTELKAEIAGVKTELKAEIAGVKTQVAALETKLEAKIDAKISAAANRLLAALVAVGGLLYAALRIF